MKKLFFLTLFFVATMSAMEQSEYKATELKLDEEGQKEFKSGIEQMAIAAKVVHAEPKKAAKYYELLHNHLSNDGFNSFFDTQKNFIKELYKDVSSNAQYQAAYNKACEHPKDVGLWDQWRLKIAAVLSQTYCESKGVTFPSGRGPNYLYDFLFLNNNISTLKEPWLGTGSYSLYLFRQIQRQKTGSIPPLPWDK